MTASGRFSSDVAPRSWRVLALESRPAAERRGVMGANETLDRVVLVREARPLDDRRNLRVPDQVRAPHSDEPYAVQPA